MGWVWNPLAIPGLAIGLLVALASAVVYWARPAHKQNRSLAILLFTASVQCAIYGLRFMAGDERLAWALWVSLMVSVCIAASAQVVFILTFDAPWLRFARAPWVQALLASPWVVVGFLLVGRPQLFAEGMVRVSALEVYVARTTGPLFVALALGALLLNIVGLAAALHAARRAVAPLERTKVRALARSFAVFVVLYALFMVYASTRLPNLAADARYPLVDVLVNLYWFPVEYLLFAALLVHGIARSQLFDVDLRIRSALRGGTIGGVFLAVFFVVSQLIQSFAGQALGTTIGGVAAGLLLFAMNPVQRFAEDLSQRAVPASRTQPNVLEERKFEVFRAALEGALVDGIVTRRERSILMRLQLELGISNPEARAMEDHMVVVKRKPRVAASAAGG